MTIKLSQNSAIVYYEKAAIEYQKDGKIEKAINSFNQIDAILNRQDKFDKAKAFLEKALELGHSANDSGSLAIATTFITLGVTYSGENQLE
ncbi:MAG TPA: tetratricopeptide repeat protein [Pyrinomonadaceae bacterium]|nr:tetratricopeptide repeat protein [Pyrinomonadaceae bacterium]